MTEAERLINDLLDHAKANYAAGELAEALKEFDPANFIQEKETALTVCHALINICLTGEKISEGSIMHKLGIGLMDYINRE